MKKIFLTLACAALSIIAAWGMPRSGIAADSKSPITVFHKSLTSADLPDPGVTMTIKFHITNSREIELPVRALIVRDGRLIEVPLLKSYLNEKDHPTFEFQFSAPLVDLNYQFIVPDGNGDAVRSDRYSVRRDCLPNFEPTDASIDPTTQPAELVKILFDRSLKLGEEIDQYEHAMKSLESLKKLLKE